MAVRNFDHLIRSAIRHFWEIRNAQASRQGLKSGRRDTGARSAVTGGAQMNGFVHAIRDLLIECEIPEDCIHFRRGVELSGWFRAEKSWDLVVVINKRLIAAIEFKSQVGPSFGNNFNNRTEEVIGSATDPWAAYREGIFQPSARPWLGYLMLLEECPASTRDVRVRTPHFPVFEEFRAASYLKRYEILLTKLLRERLYDATCFLASNPESERSGDYREPSVELSFARFAESLLARALAAVKTA